MGFDGTVLGSFVTLGLLGSAHCLGMCGGFAVAVGAASGPARWRLVSHQLLYVGGKALTYGVLGLLLALFARTLVLGGAGLVDVAGSGGLGQVRAGLALAAGLTLIVLGVLAWRGRGVGMLGAAAPVTEAGKGGPLGRALLRVRELFGALRRLPGGSGALATGLATGLLPCGWSWGALVLAATQEPLTAGLGMLLFGLGTAPALVLLGLGWGGLPLGWRARATRLLGPVLVLFGAWTLLRGAALFGPAQVVAEVLPECCADEQPHEHAEAP